MSFLGFTSTRLELGTVLPKETPTKNLEDLVRLEPRTLGLGVKHESATQDPKDHGNNRFQKHGKKNKRERQK